MLHGTRAHTHTSQPDASVATHPLPRCCCADHPGTRTTGTAMSVATQAAEDVDWGALVKRAKPAKESGQGDHALATKKKKKSSKGKGVGGGSSSEVHGTVESRKRPHSGDVSDVKVVSIRRVAAGDGAAGAGPPAGKSPKTAAGRQGKAKAVKQVTALSPGAGGGGSDNDDADDKASAAAAAAQPARKKRKASRRGKGKGKSEKVESDDGDDNDAAATSAAPGDDAASALKASVRAVVKVAEEVSDTSLRFVGLRAFLIVRTDVAIFTLRAICL
jgi:hypothetical protein